MARLFTMTVQLEAEEFYDEHGVYDPGFALGAVMETLADRLEDVTIGDHATIVTPAGVAVGEWRLLDDAAHALPAAGPARP